MKKYFNRFKFLPSEVKECRLAILLQTQMYILYIFSRQQLRLPIVYYLQPDEDLSPTPFGVVSFEYSGHVIYLRSIICCRVVMGCFSRSLGLENKSLLAVVISTTFEFRAVDPGLRVLKEFDTQSLTGLRRKEPASLEMRLLGSIYCQATCFVFEDHAVDRLAWRSGDACSCCRIGDLLLMKIDFWE